MNPAALDSISSRLGVEVVGARPLGGGCVGDVRVVELSDGRRLVAKVGAPGSGLEIEGRMLEYLDERSALRVPRVEISEPGLLVMEFIEQERGSGSLEESAADALAALHEVRPDPPDQSRFGFDEHTLIGGLHQPNPWADSWVAFFREQRLLEMARQAADAGRLPAKTHDRVRRLADRLDEWLREPGHPSLIHGDVWSGNVMATVGDDGRTQAAFIDPAIYFAHPEIELAFITLFGTFGEGFFRRYEERRGIEPGFFEERRDLYNLYPLLVHVRLFGGGYVSQVERTLSRYGV